MDHVTRYNLRGDREVVSKFCRTSEGLDSLTVFFIRPL